MTEKVKLNEKGKELKLTKQRAFIKTLQAAAIKKDIKAVTALLACMRYFGVGLEEPPVEDVDPANLDILKNYLVQQQKKQNRSNSDAAASEFKKTRRSKKGPQ